MSSRFHKLTNAALTVVAAAITAGLHSDSAACDGAMIAAWQRTWYGTYALDTPLRDYYIPRLPGRCDTTASHGRTVLIDCSGPADFAVSPRPSWNQQTDWSYHPSAAAGFGPHQFERLGQVPNDLASDPTQPGAPPSR